MRFLVRETLSYLIDVDTGDGAIAARKAGDGTLLREHSSYVAMPYNTVSTPTPVPVNQWPLWAKALKLLAKPEDKGVGDVIARTIGAENSEAFKAWHKKTFGKDCGCTERQADLNRKYPFDNRA